MKIRKAVIHNYGKIREKQIDFNDGINVIHGNNEAGKSTLMIFLISMFFGMDKPRGRSTATDDYHRYEPWNAPAFYSGEVDFLVDGKEFHLKRNFYHKEKKAELVNEKEKEQLSVEFGDLQMLLGGMTKSAYENTCCIRQSGFLTSKDFPDQFREYMTNAASVGEKELPLNAAIAELQKQKKEVSAEKKRLVEIRRAKMQQLELEGRLMAEDIRVMREKLSSLQSAGNMNLLENLPEQRQGEQEQDARNQVDGQITSGQDRMQQDSQMVGYRIKSVICGFVTLIFALMCANIPLTRIPAGILMIVSGIAAIYFLYKTSRWNHDDENSRNNKNDKNNESRDGAQEMFSSSQWENAFVEQIRDKEIRYYNLNEELRDCEEPGTDEQEATEDEEALELAIETIDRLSMNFFKDSGEQLNREVSHVLESITEGKYTRMAVDGALEVHLESNGVEIPLQSMSRGTLEQIYFALRMGIAHFFTEEEEMPFLLDDTFGMYDTGRLRQTLEFLDREKSQVLLFTCQERELELLDKLGISYHRIEL